MGDVSKDLVAILTHLLPGFLTAWVIYGLTSHPRPNQFERVVQALIYSLVISALVAVEQRTLLKLGTLWSAGVWDSSSEIVASTISALGVGLLIAYYSNNDAFYAKARSLHLTKRTGYPSEWYGAFSSIPRYVVLHLSDGRRIAGYPTEWPSDPTSGHFRLVDAAWLLDDRGEISLDGDHSVLIPGKDVTLVEFLKSNEELSDGSKTS